MKTYPIPFTKYAVGLDKNMILFGRRKASADGRRGVFYGNSFSSNPTQDMTGFRISVQSFFTAWRSNADVAGCIREINKLTGSGGYLWKKPGTEDVFENQATIDEVKKVLNFDCKWERKKRLIIRDKKICGNAFLEIVRNETKTKVLGVRYLDPRTMAIVIDQYGIVYRYIQKVAGKDTVIFDPSEIIHIKEDDDPDYPAFGMSPLEPVLWEVRTSIAANISNYYFFQNDAQPSTQYILDPELKDEEEKKKALEFIKENFGGPENRGKPTVLSGVKEIKTIGISQRDMEYIGGQKHITEKVCTALDVPKPILGYSDGMTFNNVWQMTVNFYTDTIQPEEVEQDELVNTIILMMGLGDTVERATIPKVFDEQALLEARANNSWQSGLLTMRQAKKMANFEITKEDDAEPNIDKHIIHQGGSAVLLEDVGIAPDPVNPADPNAVKNFVEILKSHFPSEE